MRRTPLRLLSLSLGLGLLPACPGDIMFDTDSNSEGEDSSSSGEPDDTTTTTDPTKPPTTTDDPTGVTTSPTTTTFDPTTTTAPTETITDTEPTTDGPTSDTTDTDTDTDTDTTTSPPTTLCERLGGPAEDGIQDLVGTFLGVVLVDQRINGYFLNDDVDGGNLLTQVTAQLGEAAGCDGVTYTGLDMITAHMGLKISTQDFTDFAEDFSAALDTHQGTHPDLTQDDKDLILSVLGGMAGDIVEDPTDDLTVYQRVGRKPAIVNLIGEPMNPDSFVGVVAADVTINSFFAASDFIRLNTCLTRQVAGLDGPTKYGQEVTSPGPGVDEGVAVDNKCRDMVSSHENLMDADMTTITIEDFLALVIDLGIAMDNAGVAPADQDIIVSALGPLCDQIVVGNAEKNKCPGNLSQVTVEAAAINKNVSDDKYNGTMLAPSMLCTTLSVAGDGLDFVESVELSFAADTTWIGDATIKIVSPDDKILTVLNRPTDGAPLPDNGSNGNGNDNGRGVDLLKKDKLTFKNGGATPAADMGATLSDNFPQPGDFVCQDDAKCEYAPSPGNGPGVDFSDFRGDTTVGDWKVCVGDSGPGDIIALDYIGLTFQKVKFDPVP
jgi:subtilisin-like proprotein convertase family protein/truncated hemoglobin YjbI